MTVQAERDDGVLPMSGFTAGPDRVSGRAFASRSPVLARQGIVASSQPLASEVGLQVLRSGGNAVDAAIAANAALCLMEPTGCGLGGDLFALFWDARAGCLRGLNGSGRSPLGLDLAGMQAAVDGCLIPPRGLLPITVPGCVDGWFELHRYGRLPMREVLAGAVDYARHGFPVSQLIALYWAASVRVLSGQPGAFAETFAPQGKTPAEGEVFRNPELARTLELIAEGGTEAFYRGPIAESVDRFMRAEGGYLRLNDFAEHQSEWVVPVTTNYRGYDIYQLPPNTQGVSVLQMLNLLEHFPVGEFGPGHPQVLHWMIEAKKLAFADRARFFADPQLVDVPLEGLVSKSYAAGRVGLIDERRAARAVCAGHPAVNDGDTVYLCAADSEGNMVSLIQSNYRGMGSGVVVPGTGFGLQNRGELFSLEAAHANAYAPGKRPFHTIIPGFAMREGAPWLAFGLMGGAMQPQGHVQVLSHLIDHGMNVQEAGDAPRWQHHGSAEPTGEGELPGGGFVELESGYSREVVQGLQRLGHDVRHGRGDFGGYQAIQLDSKNGVYHGASESRKDGHAAGY